MRTLLAFSAAILLLVALPLVANPPVHNLQPTDRLEVLVVDTQSSPLTGVTLSLRRLEDGSEPRDMGVAFTDQNGTAVIPVPEPGVYELTADLTGYLNMTLGPLPLTQEERRSVRLISPLVVTLNTVVMY